MRHLGLWSKKKAVATALLVAVAVFCLLPDVWILHSGGRWVVPFDAMEAPEVVVVPGASVLRNGKPSPILRQRVQEALWAARRWPLARIVLSGTADGGYDEPLAMSKYLKEHGIDTSRLVLDREGWSTRETISNLGAPHGRMLVVSQRWHLSRALWIARRLDWDAWGLVAGREAPSGWDNLLREHAGRVANFWQMAWRTVAAKVVSFAKSRR